MSSNRLLDAARERRLIVFAGAGVSMAQPTALPSWWDLNQAVMRALAKRAAHRTASAAELVELVVERQRSDLLPPDYVAEKIVHSLRGEYFEVLRCVDSDRPNANHLALAELAAAGRLRAIVTTNFDRAIEAAFARRGVALDVRADPAAAQGLLERWNEFESGALACQLVKLHGTADRPETIIDTLAQRSIGPAPQFPECLTRFAVFGVIGFVGFSGVDLETQPDYLGLRRAAAHGRGFTWLVQRGKSPRAGVLALVEAWGERADWRHGELPDALVECLEGVAPLAPTDATTSPVDVGAFASSWAERIAPARAAQIVAELLDTAGRSQRSRELLEQLVATFPQSAWRVQHGARDGRVMVAAMGPPGRKPDHGLGVGDPAHPTLAILAPEIDQDEQQRAQYCDALYGLADVCDRLGDRERSVDALRRSAIESVVIGDRTRQVRAIGVLADHFAHDGEREQAEAMYAAAIALCGDRRLTRGNLATNRARNALAAGAPPQRALEWLLQAGADFAAVGDERGRAGTALALADLSQRVGDGVHALRFLQEALAFAERVGDQPMLYEAWLNIGRIALRQGRADAVEPALGRALEAARALGDAEREAVVLKTLERARGAARGP